MLIINFIGIIIILILIARYNKKRTKEINNYFRKLNENDDKL